MEILLIRISDPERPYTIHGMAGFVSFLRAVGKSKSAPKKRFLWRLSSGCEKRILLFRKGISESCEK